MDMAPREHSTVPVIAPVLSTRRWQDQTSGKNMTDITERLRRLYVQDGTNYVQEAADLIDKLRAERDALVNNVHSCGPTCVKAGCVNRVLREALRDVATQRPWVGLTDDEREKIKAATLDLHGIAKYFATAIEAKLKEKNNAA